VVARGDQVCDNVINDVIDEHLHATTTLRPSATTPRPAPTRYDSVDDWLSELKMGRYRENFARCGYTRVSQLTRLSRHELTSTLGVSLVGHQKKLLDGVQALRAAHDHATTPPSNHPLLA